MDAFAWLAANTVAEAARAANNTVADAMSRPLAQQRSIAIAKAGGIDLLDLMKEGLLAPATVVSLRDVPGLDAIVTEGTGGLRIGALATVARLADDPLVRERYPALAQAAQVTASPQIRHVATVGGNLLQRPRCWYFRSVAFPCLRKGGAHCYALSGENAYHAVFDNLPCAIVHPSTLATALVALHAGIERTDASGARRVVPLETFFVPPQQDPRRENHLKPGEIVTALHLPPLAAGTRCVHLKQGERDAFDWPLVEVAVVMELDAQHVCKAASVVLGAVAPVPHRARAAERALVGRAIDEAVAGLAGGAALDGAQPLAKNAYKLPLVEALVRRAVLHAART